MKLSNYVTPAGIASGIVFLICVVISVLILTSCQFSPKRASWEEFHCKDHGGVKFWDNDKVVCGDGWAKYRGGRKSTKKEINK